MILWSQHLASLTYILRTRLQKKKNNKKPRKVRYLF